VTCLSPHLVAPFADFDPLDLAVRIAGNGSYQVVVVCSSCKTQSGPIAHWRLDRMGVVISELPVVADYRGGLGRCSRRGCDREAVEDHHFAPRAVFGDEADEWPRALLCVGHHSEWHERMRAA
jgi:hypothetical protein